MINKAFLTLRDRLSAFCSSSGLRITQKRLLIADIVSDVGGHPDVDEIHNHARRRDPDIALSTVYRTLKLLERAKLLDRHNFSGGKSRFEQSRKGLHFHLIDTESGTVLEFRDDEMAKLQHIIAKKLGYELTGVRLELFGRAKKS